MLGQTAAHPPHPPRRKIILGEIRHGWPGGADSCKDRAARARHAAVAVTCLKPAGSLRHLGAPDLGHGLQCWERVRGWIEAEPGRGCLLVTHDLLLAARFADELVLLDRGRVAASGSPPQVLTPERIASVYGVEARVGRDAEGRLVVSPLRSLAGSGREDRPENFR